VGIYILYVISQSEATTSYVGHIGYQIELIQRNLIEDSCKVFRSNGPAVSGEKIEKRKVYKRLERHTPSDDKGS